MMEKLMLLYMLLSVATAAYTMKQAREIKVDFWKSHMEVIRKNADLPSILGSPQKCTEGRVQLDGEIFECDKVDFLSFIGRGDTKVIRESFSDSFFEMSDIWGYLAPSGKEITLACQTNSMLFIDSTDPLNPKVLGYMESHRAESFWCDVKVYKGVAYIVQDRFAPGGNDKGIQVFDLSRLEERSVLNSAEPVKFEPDFTYAEHGAVHNVVIDTESGFLYNVGTNGGNDCNEGLHIVDLSEPLEPTFVGCAGEDGYVHDAQCLVYDGPDTKFQGKEICFGFNEDTITIYDVSDKSAPAILSKVGYPEASYTHQGWLNPEQTHLLMNDELDEETGVVPNTRTYVVNVESLENPFFTGAYNHPVVSIDHNLYFFGDMHRRGYLGNGPREFHPALDYAYCSNYASGVRIIDTSGMTQEPPVITQAGFFKVSQESGNQFFGAWSSYLHPSGVLAVTSIERGVFFLNFTDTFNGVPPPPVSLPPDDQSTDESADESEDETSAGLIVLFVLFAVIIVVAFVLRGKLAKKSRKEQPFTEESKAEANPMFHN